MKKTADKKLRWAWRVLPFLVSGALLAGIALYTDGFGLLGRADPLYVAAAVGSSLLANVFLASFKLWLLMRYMGVHVPFKRVVRMIMGLLSITFFMPFQTGHLLYPVALRLSEPVKTITAVECIAFDKWLSLLGTFVLVGVGYFFLPDDYFLAVPWIPVASLAAVSLLWFNRPLVSLLKKVKSLREHSRLLSSSIPSGRKLVLLALSAVYQASDSLAMGLACLALGFPLKAAMVAAYPVILLLTYLPVSVSGLGVRENLVGLFFPGMLGYDQGVAAGLLIDLTEYAVPALFGIVALPSLIRALSGSRRASGLGPELQEEGVREQPEQEHDVGKTDPHGL